MSQFSAVRHSPAGVVLRLGESPQRGDEVRARVLVAARLGTFAGVRLLRCRVEEAVDAAGFTVRAYSSHEDAKGSRG